MNPFCHLSIAKNAHRYQSVNQPIYVNERTAANKRVYKTVVTSWNLQRAQYSYYNMRVENNKNIVQDKKKIEIKLK